MWIKYYDLII